MHLEVALVAEQVLAVVRCPVGLVGARAGGLGPVVLVGCRCPFLACLYN